MPTPSLIVWWPTRAHSGIAAFVHIVWKSPKPILAGGRGDVWSRRTGEAVFVKGDAAPRVSGREGEALRYVKSERVE